MKYYLGLTTSLFGCYSTNATAHNLQQDIDLFFSTAFGNIVFFALLILLMLWLLLPLAVFGLKRKIRILIRQSSETNALLAGIKNELAGLNAVDIEEEYGEPADKARAQQDTIDLYEQIRFDS